MARLRAERAGPVRAALTMSCPTIASAITSSPTMLISESSRSVETLIVVSVLIVLFLFSAAACLCSGAAAAACGLACLRASAALLPPQACNRESRSPDCRACRECLRRGDRAQQVDQLAIASTDCRMMSATELSKVSLPLRQVQHVFGGAAPGHRFA